MKGNSTHSWQIKKSRLYKFTRLFSVQESQDTILTTPRNKNYGWQLNEKKTVHREITPLLLWFQKLPPPSPTWDRQDKLWNENVQKIYRIPEMFCNLFAGGKIIMITIFLLFSVPMLIFHVIIFFHCLEKGLWKGVGCVSVIIISIH